MAKTVPATIDSLLEKGGGVLIKRSGVWTYPNAENDRSGTNLVLPAEFLPDAVVQEALSKGELVSRVNDVMGVVSSVGKPGQDGQNVRLVNLSQAGSVEAATELPLNSRPTHDAGKKDQTDAPYVPPKATVPTSAPMAPTAVAPATVAASGDKAKV